MRRKIHDMAEASSGSTQTELTSGFIIKQLTQCTHSAIVQLHIHFIK